MFLIPAVPTTDLPLHKVPSPVALSPGSSTSTLASWFRLVLDSRLRPLLLRQFGPSLVGLSGEQVLIHDAFVVLYDAGGGGAVGPSAPGLRRDHLPMHYDESTVSFTIALDDGFEGGGTYFHDLGRALKPSVGCVLSFRGDRCFHGGSPITKGRRHIIAAFCWGADKLFWGEKAVREIIEGGRENGGREVEGGGEKRIDARSGLPGAFSFDFK